MKRPNYNRAKLQRIPLDALLEIAASMVRRHAEGHEDLATELQMRSTDAGILRREQPSQTQRARSERRLWGAT